MTHHASRFALHALRFSLFAFGIILFLLSSPTLAQTPDQSESYWLFPADGRLRHILPADINQDGIDEFLVADELGNLDLLNADGAPQWNVSFQEPLFAIATLNLNSAAQPGREIAAATADQLTLLSAQGKILWQSRIQSVTTPPTLLTGSGAAYETVWQARYRSRPVQVTALQPGPDGRDQILLLLASGQLLSFDGEGKLLWRYARNSDPLNDVGPQLAAADFDGDGRDDIALGFFDESRRFSQFILLDSDGRPEWDDAQPISGRITALTAVSFGDDPSLYLAVATNQGRIDLYAGNRRRIWQRTLNRPITSLTAAYLPGGAGLISGTEAGGIVAFNLEGRRLWSRFLEDGRIVNLSAAPLPPDENQPAFSAVVASAARPDDPADVILFSENGRSLDTLPAVDTTGLTQLTDINRDNHSELLLARFAQVELVGLGIGASETAGNWDFNLFAPPTSVLVADFDLDGRDEIVIGDRNGRIRRLDSSGRLLMLVNPEGAITHLAAIRDHADAAPNIVAARSLSGRVLGNRDNLKSWVELRRPDGDQVWQMPIPGQISALTVGELTNRGTPEIIVATSDGQIFVFSAGGTLLRQTAVSQPVRDLLVLNQNKTELLAITDRQIYLVNPHTLAWRVAVFAQPIQAALPLAQPSGENAVLAVLENGIMRGYTTQGRRLREWSLALANRPTAVFQAKAADDDPQFDDSDSLIVATDANQLLRLSLTDVQANNAWQLAETGQITHVFWTDLDGNSQPEAAIGLSDGSIHLYRILFNGQPDLTDQLNVAGSIFAMTAVRGRQPGENDLLAISETGLVRLFRAQENRPPLLTNPVTNVAPGQYSIEISVQDVDNDPVQVRLEVQDPANGEWRRQDTKLVTSSNDSLFWLIEPAARETAALNYRFAYDDGFHQGVVTPLPGPAAELLPPLSRLPLINLSILAGAGIIIGAILLRQSQLPTAKAQRFYRQLKQQPTQTLILLENRYIRTQGTPDFLLYLANEARQQSDHLITNLADGLYLLNNRPVAGLAIVINTLDALAAGEAAWLGLRRWQRLHKSALAMLESPSITELGLLHPQTVELAETFNEMDHWSSAVMGLPPIAASIRDSGRVELAQDRLIYLNEAQTLIEQLAEQLSEFRASIETTLVTAVLDRWRGLVSAEIEELRGRAELSVLLKTRRLAPTPETELVIEIRNDGRAPAENVIAALEQSPAYGRQSQPQVIRLLPPGHTRQVSFRIAPKVSDRFRVALEISYDDRNQRDKRIAFADMVHLLPPQRAFKPIPNPYLPGTPLRKNNPLFYGREELFQFIAENAGHLAQRNVLILIGQRRTGKTSVLLRLEQHLPHNLLPVYIDCQSLGVSAGMPALLNDLAWYIADALAARDIEINIPETAVWQADPTGTFQRAFLPQARQLLPPDATLLLVFDEFETFENLVDDGILPPTLFPYLRHLMQHSEGLSFVFVGSRRLEEMSADYWSVLFNIALYQRIGYLSETAAIRLITEPVRPNLIYDDLALDKIMRVTSGHPYFLQLVCYTLVKRANNQRRGYATISDVNGALDEMLSLGEVHFAYLWQRSQQTERALLMAMAHLMDRDAPFHPAELTQYLEPYGIHLSPAEVTAALNRLVERGIIREVPEAAATLYELGIGLVGLWVARYKSLSHLYVGKNGQKTAGRKRAR